MRTIGEAESQKRDKSSYRKLWNAIIQPRVAEAAAGGSVKCRRGAKHDIWIAYKAFNKHASVNYMSDAGARLDRHKVATCYMYAILAAMPLIVDERAVADVHLKLANERLAMQVGCDVLASFVSAAIAGCDELGEGEKREALERVKKGVVFPEEVGHGTYVTNFLEGLCFTQVESSYDILLMSDVMFQWEGWMMSEEVRRAIIRFYATERSSADYDLVFREKAKKFAIVLTAEDSTYNEKRCHLGKGELMDIVWVVVIVVSLALLAGSVICSFITEIQATRARYSTARPERCKEIASGNKNSDFSTYDVFSNAVKTGTAI